MKKLPLLLVGVLLGGLLATGCGNGPDKTASADSASSRTGFDLAAAKSEIEATNRQFTECTAKKDSAGIASLYTSDAEFMSPAMPAASGRSDIQKMMSGMMASGVSKVELKTRDVWGSEALLAEEGTATVYVGDKAVEEDKYIVLWKKEDGKWKMFRDIFNSNAPEAAHK